MHPRTLVILAVLLLGGAIVGRYLTSYFGWLPLSEEIVLKKAVSINVKYYDGAQAKSYLISDADEVGDTLAALRIVSDGQNNYRFGFRPAVAKVWAGAAGAMPASKPCEVEFNFSNGHIRRHDFEGPNSLGGYVVDVGFSKILSKIVSRHEGRAIDVMRPGWLPPAPGDKLESSK